MVKEPQLSVRPTRCSVSDWLKFHPSVIRIASVLTFFAFWEYVGRDMNPLFMTYPSAILQAAWDLTTSGQLPDAFLVSMEPFLIGLAISIVLGVTIGIAIGQFWLIEYILDPFISALYAIPRVALVPLIILWAGLHVTGKVTVIVSIAIFPVIINTYAGIKDVRGSLLEIGRAYCASDVQLFMKVILPAAVPYIMAGVRLSVGLAIISMIVAEFFTAINGLGGLIVFYANNFDTADLFVPIIVTGVLGVSLSALVSIIDRRLSHWRTSERERFG
jgi:ABC-type nitrate/sulfonate/bicarbonate transport system permease component